MKSIIPAVLVVLLQAGFILSVARAPRPAPPAPAGAEVTAQQAQAPCTVAAPEAGAVPVRLPSRS